MHLKRNEPKPGRFLLTALFIVTAAGCSKTESDKTPVARFDNKTLALEEIQSHIDTSQELSPVQVQQYIQRWLTEESLYREGVERGLDRSDEMNQKVEEVRRELTINALLDKEVYSQQLLNFSQNDIRHYYDAHIKEFDLMNDAALVSYVLFKKRDEATEFRNLVLKGTSWRSALVQRESSMLMRVDSSYQTKETFLPAELWRVAAKSVIRELSFPISTDNGYYILVVWRFIRQGQTADIPMVEQEIRGRLTVERRRKLFDQLIENLRAKHAIEVFAKTASDSAKSKID
jgi:hypothetical protein